MPQLAQHTACMAVIEHVCLVECLPRGGTCWLPQFVWSGECSSVAKAQWSGSDSTAGAHAAASLHLPDHCCALVAFLCPGWCACLQVLRTMARQVQGMRDLKTLVSRFDRQAYRIPDSKRLRPGWRNLREFVRIDHPDPQAKIIIDNKLMDQVGGWVAGPRWVCGVGSATLPGVWGWMLTCFARQC